MISKTLNFFIRNVLIIFICISTIIFINYLFHDDPFYLFFDSIGRTVILSVGFILTSEIALFLNQWMNRRLSGNVPIKKIRTYNIVIMSSLYAIVLLIGITIFFKDLTQNKAALLFLGFTLIYFVIFDLMILMRNYYLHLQREKDTNANLKEEKLKSDFKALQNQLNPHFLFNSINVLVSEIYEDQERAAKYAGNLSDIYRYVLQSADVYTTELKNELTFLQSYIYVYRTKYANGFNVELDIDEAMLMFEIPPLTLQILVENAIKHNAILPDNPLCIQIKAKAGKVTVKNNITTKKDSFSTTTGLKNIKKRYELISNQNVFVEQNATEFIVTVPLLEN